MNRGGKDEGLSSLFVGVSASTARRDYLPAESNSGVQRLQSSEYPSGSEGVGTEQPHFHPGQRFGDSHLLWPVRKELLYSFQHLHHQREPNVDRERNGADRRFGAGV